MRNKNISILAKVGIFIFLYIFIYFAISAVFSKPTEGDSIAYHIPIAVSIIHGAIFNPLKYFHRATMEYSPGAGESILTIFMLLHIPLNLYNFLGLALLLLATYKLGKTFKLENDFALVFALSVSTLHIIIRWLLSQTIDTWLLVFFTWSLILLEKPEKKISYFLKLGFSLGMLVGIKYTGPYFFIILAVMYAKNIFPHLNFKRFLAFFIPFSIFGLFWYIRNFLLTGDPYYPQSFLFFKGIQWHILDYAVWKIVFLQPGGIFHVLNAVISEYTVWSLSLPFAVGILIASFIHPKNKKIVLLRKLIIIGLANFVFYFFLPSGPIDSLMTSSLRYSYPAFIPWILSAFIFAKEYGKEEVLSVIAIVNMILLPELNYHPKILLLLIPIGLLIYFPNFRKILSVQLLQKFKK